MPIEIKPLIVVLGIAILIFALARPIGLKFSSASDYTRRRNIWLILTAAAFLSPNFWLFVVIAAPLLIWGCRKDSNAVAFYLLMMHVVQPIDVQIPVVGINQLFAMNMYRLLSFCVLLPTAWRLIRSKPSTAQRRFSSIDALLLAYTALQVALYVPPDLPGHVILSDSATNVLRRIFLSFVDVLLLYYVVSRYCRSRKILEEVCAAFCMSCVLMSAVAIFETVKHWLLYTDIAARWGDVNTLFYQFRGDSLRAQASSGHALALGALLALAFGFWLNIGARIPSRMARFACTALLLIGLLATYSRGPWIGAVMIFLTYTALNPGAIQKSFKTVILGAIAATILLMTPLGDRIIAVLPFMGGSIDSSSLTYRERLLQRSLELVRLHPFFGDQLAYSKLEDLRQGQGIIDLVNTYVGTALLNGLVGLCLFVGFVVVATFKVFRTARHLSGSNPKVALLGMNLVACTLGLLLMLADCSFILGYQQMFYVLGGSAAAYLGFAGSLSRQRRVPENAVARQDV